MSAKLPRLQRHALTAALLSALSLPAFAGGNCQLVDGTGAPITVDSAAPGVEALACGPDAKAIGAGATAVGDQTTATGKNTTAVGSWIDLDGDGLVDANEITWANGDNATAIGAAAQAQGSGTVALGVRSVANLDNSVAIGNQAQTQAVGTSTVTTREGAARNDAVVTTNPSTLLAASGSNSIAMGNLARVNGGDSVVIGPSASAEKITHQYLVAASPAGSKETQTTLVQPVTKTVVVGSASRANGDNITVIGAGATAEASTRVPLNGFGGAYVLTNVPAPATNSTVVGSNAASKGVNNVVIGSGAATSGAGLDATGTIELKDQNSTLVGYQAFSVRGWGSAFGYHAVAYGYATTAIGTGTYAIGTGSTAVGGWFDQNAAFGATPVNTPPTGLGFGTSTPGLASQAFGANARTWGNYDTALGPAARTSDFNSASGNMTRYQSNDQKVINGSIAVGFVAYAQGQSSIAIGQQSMAHDSYAMAIGSESVAWGIDSLALGNAAIATWHEDIAIGKGAEAWGGFGTGNTAFGNGARVGSSSGPDISNAMAFGGNAEALADGASAFGAYAYADGDYAVAMGTNAFARGLNSSAFGYNSVALEDDSVAIGAFSVADRANTVSVGSIGYERQITNVAAGAEATDAVNKRQMDESISSALLAGDPLLAAVFYDGDGKDTVTLGGSGGTRISNVMDGVEAQDAINKGQLDTAITDVDTALGNLDTAVNDVGVALDDLGSFAVKYDDAAGKGTITLGGNSGTRISNVMEGVDAMDAINKGQMDAALATVGASNVAQLGAVAAAFGGGALLGADGLLGTPSYAILGNSYGNVGDAFGALDNALTGFSARLGQLEVDYSNGVPSGTGEGLAVGDNSVATDSRDTAIGNGATVSADGSTAVGDNSSISAAATNAVAVGADTTVTAASGTAIGQGAAVTAENAVALGKGSVADQADTVSVGSAGSERRVTNVAAGSAATDAANVQQMQDGDVAAIASANAYTDTTATQTLTRANSYTDSRLQALDDQFSDLSNEIGLRLGKQDERIDRQGAMSSAMMNMAINAANARSPRGRVAVGAGWQNGENALSVGYSKAVGERASFSIGGAFSSDDSSAGVGFGIDL